MFTLGLVKAAPNVLLVTRKYAKVLQQFANVYAIVRGDRMAAACKLLNIASVIPAVSPCCLAFCYPWL